MNAARLRAARDAGVVTCDVSARSQMYSSPKGGRGWLKLFRFNK